MVLVFEVFDSFSIKALNKYSVMFNLWVWFFVYYLVIWKLRLLKSFLEIVLVLIDNLKIIGKSFLKIEWYWDVLWVKLFVDVVGFCVFLLIKKIVEL